MHKYLVSSLLLLPLVGASAALAQNESLLISAGDLVQVDVIDTPDMEQQVRVSDAGVVPLAYLGDVKVAGETPSDAAAQIRGLLVAKNIMKHPQVTVRVEEYATGDVSVLGQVHTPGSYPLTTPQSILKVLSLAGGLTDSADRHVTIRRHGSGEELEYYAANDSKEALAEVPLVHPGDTVLIPSAPVVYVMGDVGKPGGYPIATNDSQLSMMQAITMAGSANKTAIQSHVRLIRTVDGQKLDIPVHLDQIQKGKLTDIALKPNDIVYVPFSWAKNVVLSSSSIAAGTASAAVYAVH